MAKFKCNYTGQIYEFTAENDITDMRRHPEYSEVVEEVKKEEPKKTLKLNKDE